jgi:transcription-repair coupling factor (superfamily II helicase)
MKKNTTLPPIRHGKTGLLWGGVRPGTEAYALFSLLKNTEEKCAIVVVKDALRARILTKNLKFFLPSFSIQELPAWDSHPFENMSPSVPIAAARMALLSSLSAPQNQSQKLILVTTLRSFIQKVPHHKDLKHAHINLDSHFKRNEQFETFLQHYGFERVHVVRSVGEYAVRGSIVDIFPPGNHRPVRCDFFGDELESIHSFDPVTQRRLEKKEHITLFGASEICMDNHAHSLFKQRYRKLAILQECTLDQELLESIHDRRRSDGLEYWLGLLAPQLQDLVSFCQDSRDKVKVILSDDLDTDDLIHLYENTDKANAERSQATKNSDHHHPHPPTDSLYVAPHEWNAIFSKEPHHLISMVSHDAPLPEQNNWQHSIDTKDGYNFLADRKAGRDVYKKLAENMIAIQKNTTKKIVLVFNNAKTGTRITKILKVHGIHSLTQVKTYHDALASEKGMVTVAVLPMEAGFSTDNTVFITQEDIIGNTENTRSSRQNSSRSSPPLSDTSMLNIGELVVHHDYGIGRYQGLEEHSFDGNIIACLRILYLGDDSILLPVHNLDMLSRYGSRKELSDNHNHVALDKLGGTAWQARKLKARKKIMEMASTLLETEAQRHTRTTSAYRTPDEIYHEFCALFPHTETPDQERAEYDVLDDLAKTQPMDRLICGDVGFGKTEIAMRAAFTVAASGDQVVLIAPTTLLAHQHFKTFSARFQGFGINIGLLSRFVKGKDARNVKEKLADGSIHIAIGTHALLSADVKLANPGLVILDEEQLFGVAQKEKIKRWKTHIHVLTLSATPIPRTLQMALSGVRDMSMIASPPVNRHAIRTYISVEDDMMIRRAIRAETSRNGKIYYVCPRVQDIETLARKLEWLVPEANVITAHGKMKAAHLEDAMRLFIEGDKHILLATPIVGAGLDVSSANTMIIHRCHLFGLAQLYQLRGRVGRASIIAHCYLTYPRGPVITPVAKERIHIMRTHDGLGAGFKLASHDLDLRGAGNLLGSDQSGHVREVGVELYQKMLKDTIQSLRHGNQDIPDNEWSPQVQLGFDAHIPEDYIPDMGLRLQLYRRLGDLPDTARIVAMKHEIADRFGPLPQSVHGLLHVMATRVKCREIGVEKLNAHKSGISLSFRNNRFNAPEKLLQFLDERKTNLRIDSNHNLIGRFDWRSGAARLRAVSRLIDDLKELIAS